MSNNPFFFSLPVRDRRQFFGREAIIQNLMSRLRLMQDSSIIGERRMGRTSLLYHLQDPEVVRRYGLDPDHYLFVYFSFDEVNQLNPTLFWQHLLARLAEKINDEALRGQIHDLYQLDEIDPLDIEDLFLAISDKGFRVVFLLDEFEAVTQATRLDADFFSHLRSLATGQYVGLIFVTSSRQKLSELSHAGIVGSPFFNIFETFFLKPFKSASAEATIKTLLNETSITFEDQEQAYLMELSGRQPFFLQMGASYLFDTYNVPGLADPKLRPARLERVESAFMTQAELHFVHYWSQSTDRERILLVALSSLKQGNSERLIDMSTMKQAYRDADVAINVLQDRGLISREEGGYKTFSPAYERWIIQEMSQAGRHGDYTAWLKQNKPYYGGSLQTLYDHADEVNAGVNPKYWNLLTEWLSKSDQPGKMIELFKQAVQAVIDRPLWLKFV